MKKDVEFDVTGTPLPDALLMNNGKRVETEADWKLRREEIKEILQSECYGHRPPEPQEKPIVRMIQPHINYGNSSYENLGPVASLRIFSSRPWADSEWCFDFMVFTPCDLKDDEKLPTMICCDGNWARAIKRDVADLVAKFRFALVIFNRCDFVTDPPFPLSEPFPRDSYLQRRFADYDFGGVMGWSYGASRVIDALEFVPNIDLSKLAVCGHSRGGKAAMLAGAFDERIAVTCSSGSGSGGAGSWHYLAKGAEPYDTMANVLGYWFNDTFQKYVGHTADLPYDAHFLKALCLPRAQISTDGFADLWANPAGACITTEATRKIARTLGYAPDLLAMHFREGMHEHAIVDWRAMFEYCRHVFFGEDYAWISADYPFNGIEKYCQYYINSAISYRI